MRRPLTALLAGLALFFHPAISAQTPPENAAPAKIRVSLLPGAPALDSATQGDLVKWLSQFQNTVYQMRIRDYLEMVDWEALVAASFAEDAVKPDEAKRLRMKKILMMMTERTFPMLRPFFLFQDAEIRRVDLTGDKAVIIARIHDEEDLEYKVRWWLQRHGDKWQMTDFENITVNLRLSAALQMGAQAAASKEGLKMEQSVKLTQMGVAIQDGDLDKAYALIKELEASKLPAVLTEIFLASKVAVLSQMDDKDDEFEATLKDLEKAAPDNPVLFLMRTTSSYEASDYKNTIVWAKKIGATVGHDEDTWSMLTDSHRELNEDKEYLAAAEGWAVDYPNSPTALWTFWQALPATQREGKIKPLLEQITPAEDALTEFADDAMLEDDTAALKLVLGVMQARKVSPETIQESQSMLQEILDAQKKAPEKKE